MFGYFYEENREGEMTIQPYASNLEEKKNCRTRQNGIMLYFIHIHCIISLFQIASKR